LVYWIPIDSKKLLQPFVPFALFERRKKKREKKIGGPTRSVGRLFTQIIKIPAPSIEKRAQGALIFFFVVVLFVFFCFCFCFCICLFLPLSQHK